MRLPDHAGSCLCAAIAVLPGSFAWSQSFPDRPVRLIVPFPSGGTTDIVARAVGQKLAEAWGQQVVVDNRAGAAGNIGAEIAARARPDGHTILLAGVSFAVNPGLYRKIPYDPVRDFIPITVVASTPSVLVVHPSVRASSVKELIALARLAPGQLNYASAGSGGSQHLAAELFNAMADVAITHVPYRGVAESYLDLLSGRVQVVFDSQPSATPHLRTGKIRALAVTGSKRAIALPDLPTVAEAGVPGYEVTGWYGAFAPAGTPQDVVGKLATDFVNVVRRQEVSTQLLTLGAEPIASSREQFSQFLDAELKKWARVLQRTGIRVD